jgi:predicted nucleic acid-binding protein
MIVMDASAAVELLLGTEKGARVFRRLHERGAEPLHCPHLFDLEVASALRSSVQRGDLSAGRAHEALMDLHDLAVTRYPHDVVLDRVWELRDAVTTYDGCYLALAEALEAPLLTCDKHLGKAHGHRARVEVI